MLQCVIPYASKHPTQHKYAGIKFLYNWLNSYDLHKEEYQYEVNVIHNILCNNSFPIKGQKTFPHHTETTTTLTNTQTQMGHVYLHR